MEQAGRAYRCAGCGREIRYEQSLPDVYPFCGPRCKMADLGRWLREQYTIERELTPEELENNSPPHTDPSGPES